MTFRQTLKKLSEPARNYKKQLIVLFLRGIFLSLLAPIFSLMIKDLINGLQSHDTNSFLKSITILWSLMFLNIVTTYFVRINNARFKIGIQNSLYQKYLSTYLLLENNFTEKIWTGKINNILQKWCDNWMSLVSNFPLEGFAYILRLFVILFIMAYYLWWFWFIVVLVVFSLSFAIAQYGNTKTWPIKKQLRDYYTSADSDIIKIIMSF